MLEANLEDFLEAVLRLKKDDGWALTREVADYIGVKIFSAYVSARKLSSLRLVKTSDNSEKIVLTPLGEELAKGVNKKHNIIKRFFNEFLCVPENVAEEDAHSIEHVISDESLEKIVSFFEFIEEDPESFLAWFSKYKTIVCPLDKPET